MNKIMISFNPVCNSRIYPKELFDEYLKEYQIKALIKALKDKRIKKLNKINNIKNDKY